MKKDNKILLFQRILPSYRTGIFRELSKRENVVLCYSSPRKGSSVASYEQVDFSVEKLCRFYYTNRSTTVIQNIFPVIRKYKPKVVISEASPSFMTVWLLLSLRVFLKFKLILWSHGVKFSELTNPFRSLSGRMKLYLFNKADCVILYSVKRKEILGKHINNPGKLFVASNTLDTYKLGAIYKTLSIEGKDRIKAELKWNRKYNLLFIGRLIESKGLDILLETFNQLRGSFDIMLHIVGSGPLHEKLSKQSENFRDICIHGAIYDDNLTGKLLYAADLMVLPGDLGLSVIHAFSFGCPVITCAGDEKYGPYHGPEIEYLVEGYNGFIIDKDPEMIASKILSVLSDDELLSILSANALKTIEEKAGIENMIGGISKAIAYVRKANSQKMDHLP